MSETIIKETLGPLDQFAKAAIGPQPHGQYGAHLRWVKMSAAKTYVATFVALEGCLPQGSHVLSVQWPYRGQGPDPSKLAVEFPAADCAIERSRARDLIRLALAADEIAGREAFRELERDSPLLADCVTHLKSQASFEQAPSGWHAGEIFLAVFGLLSFVAILYRGELRYLWGLLILVLIPLWASRNKQHK